MSIYFEHLNQLSGVVSFSRSKVNEHNILTVEAQSFDLDGVGFPQSCPDLIGGTSRKVSQTTLSWFHSHRTGITTILLQGAFYGCNMKAFLSGKSLKLSTAFIHTHTHTHAIIYFSYYIYISLYIIVYI